MFSDIFQKVGEISPLIHCITNYVTTNDCANILLACGASPIMADDAEEVAEITALCTGLVLNIGTLNARTTDSMLLAGKRANDLGHPVVFDPVGAGASSLRTETAQRLLSSVKFSVIRGNASEIRTLIQETSFTQGVDAAPEDAVHKRNISQILPLFQTLAKEKETIVAVTGAVDILTDGESTYLVHNGHSMMSKITGTGCMLTCLIAAFVAVCPSKPLQAATAAIGTMGLCGQRAYDYVSAHQGGTGMFRMALIDAVSTMTPELLKGGLRIEKV